MNLVGYMLVLLVFSGVASAQQGSLRVWVELSDKNNSPFSIEVPSAYLSPKAIERRQKQNIPIRQNDLPVNPGYIAMVQATGANVIHTSRWFNALSIEVADSAVLNAVLDLPFVRYHQRVAKYFGKRSNPSEKLEVKEDPPLQSFQISDYGVSFQQLRMINGHTLHQKGLKGQGMTIAVMDAGFTNVHINKAFENLRREGRLLGAFDLVEGGKVDYSKHGHGTSVLSVLTAEVPGEFIGAAPESGYYLFRTENGEIELLVEEDNWIAAAEMADSLGVDIITTSLGYSRFQDSTMDHTYEDMDGNTTRISRAADIAASKGILVVNSAGNEGNSDWYHITAPSDGDSVLAVGAANLDSSIASFSSRGPSADGDVKPNVCALGAKVAVVYSNDRIGLSNGTSFSSPIIAGLAACLWQAFPKKTNMEIFDAIQQSGHLYDFPNDEMGYGLPDFDKAYNKFAGGLIDAIGPQQGNVDAIVFPNPVSTRLNVFLHSRNDEVLTIKLFDMAGNERLSSTKFIGAGTYDKFETGDLTDLAVGDYVLRVHSAEEVKDLKFTKIPR